MLQGRVEPRQCELSRRGIVCQRGDREDIVGRQFLDEVRDAGDIVRARPPLATGHRVDDIRRGTARDDDRPILREGAVVFGIAAMEGKGRRQHGPVLLDHGGRELDDLCLGLHLATVLLEDRARLFVPHQQADVLEDLQGGGVRAFDLLLREKGGKVDQRTLLVIEAGQHMRDAPPAAALPGS